jgi:hypothetical protein
MPAVAVVMLIMAAGGVLPPVQSVAASTTTCTTSTPDGTYSVQACITAPGSTLSGKATISATFTIIPGTGPTSGVQRAVFYLGGAYLLTDYQATGGIYTFTLNSARFVDGPTTLEVEALMRDKWVSDRASLPVTLSNGVLTPPVNTNSFSPTLGTWSGSGSIVVAAAGDGASGETNAASATNLIKSWNPNLLLYLGDVYEKGSSTEFDNWYASPTGPATGDYGQFRSITDPTIGNHEYSVGAGAPGYFDYWNNPPHYYSYTIGAWHFISLDSTSQYLSTPGGNANDLAQQAWLASDLSADTSPCTLAYWHHPLYNVGPEGNTIRMATYWSMLADAGVDIVLNGHDHDYQRWTPLDGAGAASASGMTEFVVGTGGHGTQTFIASDSRLVKGFDSTTSPSPIGALQLKLSAGSATYKFFRASDGATLDSGTISCGTVPGQPGTPTATASDSAASVSWTAPSDTGGSPITAYTVTSTPGNKTCTWSSGPLSCTVTGLTNGTSYTFKVTATNGAGTGPASSPSNSVTPATVPDAPTGVSGSSGNGQVLVSWTAPAYMGGSPITAYTVTSTPGAKTCTWSSGALSCVVTGLTNGTPYTFTVTATNGAGTGPPSAASAPVTPATTPGAPTGVGAAAGNAQALVTWTAPASTGGLPITAYTVTSSPGAKTCAWSSGALSCVVTGLTNGTPYTFTVTATTGAGTGPASAPSNSVTPKTVPGAPTGVTATALDGAARVGWTAPASIGGSPITAYTVTSSPGAKTCAWSSGALSCAVTGLTNGTPYTFTVTATNGAGTGIPSAPSAAVSPTPLVLRYAGATRFATAAAISAHTFSPGVPVAYIAYAGNFPDALAAAAAAGTVQGPVLLANTTGPLDPATIAELVRLQPDTIIVLGGTGVISDAVLAALAPYATNDTVLRYSGPTRFATAAAISAHTFSPGVPVAYIAYAGNFPDALAGAAAAGTIKGPVLLANTTGPLDPATVTELVRLKPARIIVLGGTGVISDAVMSALAAYASP